MKKLLTMFILMVVTCVLSAQSIQDLKFLIEEYPPYNFTENGKPSGIAVDVLVEMFERLGINKSIKDIQVLPWARGVKGVNENKNVCLFSTSITAERKNILGWKFVFPIPLTSDESDNHIVARKGKGIKFNSIDDLKKYGKKIGVVRGDVGLSLMIEAGINASLLDKASEAKSLVKKLDKGRYDMISYAFEPTKTKMIECGIDPSKYEVVFAFKNQQMGYAFNKNVDPEIIQKFQKALDEIHADGTAEKIKNKYLK